MEEGTIKPAASKFETALSPHGHDGGGGVKRDEESLLVEECRTRQESHDGSRAPCDCACSTIRQILVMKDIEKMNWATEV